MKTRNHIARASRLVNKPKVIASKKHYNRKKAKPLKTKDF